MAYMCNHGYGECTACGYCEEDDDFDEYEEDEDEDEDE